MLRWKGLSKKNLTSKIHFGINKKRPVLRSFFIIP
jgi:hypothetical protein